MRVVRTSLRVEKRMLRDGVTRLAGVDEVGRGALGGPVTVGVVVVDATVTRPLPGVRDSKLLTPEARERLVPRIRRWAVDSAVGHASAAEIDSVGILGALRLAALRALADLTCAPDAILLDGNHNWISRTSPTQPTLFGLGAEATTPTVPPVTTRIKADLSCAAVAAASVLAKCERDAIMVDLARTHGAYGWDENKGYATPGHRAALRDLGPCTEHRRSWHLIDVAGDEDASGVVLAQRLDECPDAASST